MIELEAHAERMRRLAGAIGETTSWRTFAHSNVLESADFSALAIPGVRREIDDDTIRDIMNAAPGEL